MGNYFLFNEHLPDSEKMQPFWNSGIYCARKQQVHGSQPSAADHTNHNLELTFRFFYNIADLFFLMNGYTYVHIRI